MMHFGMMLLYCRILQFLYNLWLSYSAKKDIYSLLFTPGGHFCFSEDKQYACIEKLASYLKYVGISM